MKKMRTARILGGTSYAAMGEGGPSIDVVHARADSKGIAQVAT